MPQSKLSSLLVTTWLLGTIACKSRVDELIQSFIEYEIIYPRIITDNLSSSLRDHRLPFENHSRNLQEETTINVIIKNWTLRTTINDRLILSKDLHSRGGKYFNKNFDCDLRHGIVENNENISSVVLTICLDEIYGFVIVDGRSYFIEPLTNGRHIFYESNNTGWWSSSRKSSRNFGPSIEIFPLYYTKKKDESRNFTRRLKREIPNIKSNNGFYNLTGDVFDMENFDLGVGDNEDFLKKDEDVMIERLSQKNDPEDVGYFSNPSWSRSKVPKRKQLPRRWLEVAIAVDYSVIEFHGPRVQQYVLALLNIVSAIFRDPSLDSNMILVVARVILYKEKKDSLIQDGNSKRSLENVNKWNRKLLSLSKDSHDIAIWLTRLDIGGPSGYAPVSGVCNPARSCTLNRDEGLTSAFIIAHEVAHILGLTHDGDKTAGNFCVEEASLGSVMAPMVAATFHHFYWSTCSKKEFHRKVKQWSCLLNRPNDNNTTRLNINIQEMFTMDEQCRVEFGQGYHLCKSFEIREPCSRLWCGNSNISQACKTKKGPPMEGTLCGKNKWCINGRCESMDRERSNLEPLFYNPRNGGWSAWSSWNKCTRTCGIGIQCRLRSCNNPRPAYGGKYCIGPSDDCKICESAKCTTNVDLRAQQCSRLIGILDYKEISSKVNMTWLAYEPEEHELKCRLICRSRETGEIFYSGKNLMNGTPCSYGSTDICIQGECRRMGCDNVFNSEKILDSCGTCNGNDTDCDHVVNKFQRKLRRAMTRVAVLPRNGINMAVNVTIMKTSFTDKISTTFVIMDGKRRRHKVNDFNTKGHELLAVEGIAFRIQIISNNKYAIKTRGIALDDVIVSFVVPTDVVKSGTSIAVSSRYSINHNERNTDKRYLWSVGGWNFCSVSCGGGIRRKMIVCKDDKTGRIVSRRKCAFLSKPFLKMETCNIQSCDYKWLPGPWETCSVTCGHFGIQTRQLHCVRSSYNESEIISSNELEAYRIILRPSLCVDHQRPIIEQECNRIAC
ncbi:A disintegrin and metalloproteinase with thrombospondin motifs 2-like [Vespa mandarinia]|uniref:A disintegrin and metalloproteinase with thrombospondin motifs 2-like n=1 Tax=Vespa mandarinia TaxID=7446 RepID=UPI00160E8A15|nr:A disintegrin and metalloproteinase with thrombospondin motifs 2-like [Vespa mandarinia]XP_035719090.1 A disintegrin and metalloproteinase with thrombospondin motifs 2-like [Vespa mandarinia]